MKQFNKMMMSVLILLSLMTASLSANAVTQRLLFSSPDSYVGFIKLQYPDNYIYYIFVGSELNTSAVVHPSTLGQNNEKSLASYYSGGLYTYITDRQYRYGYLNSFNVDKTGVKRIYGIK